ncbi:hypothetical protein [Proteus phage vB_PmiP_RS51pmB]|nr:hypothetical protein [Proteus phage vB_PmiP_RS51pmB]
MKLSSVALVWFMLFSLLIDSSEYFKFVDYYISIPFGFLLTCGVYFYGSFISKKIMAD